MRLRKPRKPLVRGRILSTLENLMQKDRNNYVWFFTLRDID